MSFTIKIKTPNAVDVQAQLNKFVTPEFAEKVQQEVVNGQIKKLIQAGRSPVEGFGRFDKYKDVKSYPGKRKANRPVNLYLTGEMLGFYQAVRISGRKLLIGISPFASGPAKIKATANNLGTEKEGGGIVARRFVPVNDESFTISVIRKLKDLYARRLRDILSKR